MNILNIDESEFKTQNFLTTDPEIKYDIKKENIKIDVVNGKGMYKIPYSLCSLKITGLIFYVNPEEYVDLQDTILLEYGNNRVQSTNVKLLVNCNEAMIHSYKFIVPTNFQINVLSRFKKFDIS